MSLIDRIFRRGKDADADERVEIKANEALIFQVLRRPWEFNRFTRRAVGFRMRTSGFFEEGPESSFFVPRYIRRHFTRSRKDVAHAFTRRNRKRRARIGVAMRQRQGVAPVTLSAFRSKRRNQVRMLDAKRRGARPIPVPA